MPKFESFDSDSYIDREEDGRAFENQKVVLDKLSKKFPKFKSMLTALVLTTLALSVPESTKSNDVKSEISISQIDVGNQELIKSALENIDSAVFRDAARSIHTEFEAIELESPRNFLYSGVSDYSSLNDKIVINDDFEGEIPESAQNVFINYSFTASEVVDFQGSDLNIFNRTQTVFNIDSIEEDFSPELETQRIQLQGFGANKKEALQNALESAVGFFGLEVESKDNLVLGGDSQVTTSNLGTTGRYFIKEYKLVEEEEIQDENGLSLYRIVLDIIGGKVIEDK